MNGYAYYNGKFGRADEIAIPLTDRSIYFGDAVYDVAIARKKIYQLDEHVTRFLSSARLLGFEHEYTHDQLSRIISKVWIRSGITDAMVYFQMSRNAPKRNHLSQICDGVNLLVLISELTVDDGLGELDLITCEDKRYLYCNIKTVNLLPAVIASSEAEAAGCDEAVLHRGDIVTECAHSNISILRGGTLYTHPTGEKILPGITRRNLLDACRELGIEYCETPFTIAELYECDEALVTSTTKLCRRARSLNGVRIGGKDPSRAMALCGKLLENFVYECDREE